MKDYPEPVSESEAECLPPGGFNTTCVDNEKFRTRVPVEPSYKCLDLLVEEHLSLKVGSVEIVSPNGIDAYGTIVKVDGQPIPKIRTIQLWVDEDLRWHVQLFILPVPKETDRASSDQA